MKLASVELRLSWWRRYRRRLIAVACGLVALVLANYGLESRAGIAKFYPATCLGGWESPEWASGAPDGQSAELKPDTLAEIFCGDFRGEIPDDTEPKLFQLRLTWQLKYLTRDSLLSASTSLIGDDFAEQAEIILGASSDLPLELTISDEPVATTTSIPSDTSVVPNAENPDDLPDLDIVAPNDLDLSSETTPTPADTDQSPPESTAPALTPETVPAAEISWWRHLMAVAWATTTAESLMTDQTVSRSLSNVQTAAEILAAGEQVAGRNQELEVLYTLDSRQWQVLGRIGNDNWREASFTLPISRWSDLSKLQISVRRLSTIDEAPLVELDGMELAVLYQSPFDTEVTPAELALLPRITAPANLLLLAPTSDFAASETPRFNLNPSLVSDLLANLPEADPPAPAGLETATSSDFQSQKEDDIADTSSNLQLIPAELRLDLEKLAPGRLLNWLRPASLLQPVVAAAGQKLRVLRTEVLDADGKPTDLQVVTRETETDSAGGQIEISVPKDQKTFRPGRYRLRVELLQARQVIVTESDFTWGVLALNANKSVYAPNERAYLQFAVLDDTGHTVCDAELSFRISGPNNLQALLSTATGEIVRNKTCGANNVTDEPDYFAYYFFQQTGVYKLTLTDLKNNHEIRDEILVRAGDNLTVERIGATRINPFKADYAMRLRVSAREAFTGLLGESLPSELQAINSVTAWPINIAAGETQEFSYTYHAPPVSPQIYLLGPARLTQNNQSVFTEEREWQIAADSACQSNGTGGGNWNTASTWSNCNSTTPQSADTVTILNGDTVTLDTDSTITSLTIDNGGTLTTDNNSRTLTLTPAAAGTAFTNNGTFTAGNSTVKITSDAAVTLLSGNFVGSNAFYQFQLTPTLTAARTYTFGAAASTTGNFEINPVRATAALLTVNMSGGITVAATATTTITRTSSATSRLDTTTSNYPFTSGHLDIKTGGTFTANGSTLTLNGSDPGGILFTRAGTFTRGTSTVVFNPDASVVLTSGSFGPVVGAFNNLQLAPTLSANRTYTFGSGNVTVFGDMDINPSASSALRLTAELGAGGLRVVPAKTLTITGSSSGLSTLDTTTANYSLTAGFLNIATAGTLTANGSTITLDGVSGTIFTRAGTFNAGSSTVAFTGEGSLTTTSGTITFYNLNLAYLPLLTGGPQTYTMGSGAVTVANNFTINPVAEDVPGRLTVNLGASLTVNATTTITGGGANVATSTLDTVAGSNYAFSTGSLVMAVTGNNFNANNSSITVNNHWWQTSSGALFRAGGSTVTFASATSSTIDLGGTGADHQFYNLTVNKSGTASASAITNHLDVANNLTITAGTLDLSGKNLLTTNNFSNSGTLRLQGAETVSFSVNDTNSGTWEYYGDGTGAATTHTIKDFGNLDYWILKISDSSASNQDTFRANATLNASSTLTIAGGTMDISTNANSLIVDGLMTLNSGTFLADNGAVDLNTSTAGLTLNGGTFSAPTGTMTIEGNLNSSGSTFVANGGTVVFDTKNASTRAINFNTPITFSNLTFSPTAAVIYEFQGSATTTNFTLAGSSAITLSDVSGDGTVAINTLGHATSTNTSDDTGGTLPVRFRGTGNQNLAGPSGNVCERGAFPSIEVDKPSGTLTFGTDIIGVSGHWTYTQGTVDASANSSTVCIDANSGNDPIISGKGPSASMSFYNLTIGPKNQAGYALLGSDIIVSNNLTVETSETLDAGNFNINVGRDFGIAAGAFICTDGVLTLDGGGAQSVATAGLSQAICNLTVNKSAGSASLASNLRVSGHATTTAGTLDASTRTLQVDGKLTVEGGALSAGSGVLDVGGDLLLSGGTLTAPSAGAFTIAGSYQNSGGTLSANSGTVTFDATASGKTLSGTMTGSSAFYNLSFNGSGGAWTFSNNASTTNNFTYAAGTITAPALLSVANNWTRSGGTFNHNSGTVELTGTNQAISGATTFYNLKKRDISNNSSSAILTFSSNATTTIAGLVTFTGLDNDDRVDLRASTWGTRWGFTVNGTYDINYASTTDSDASLGSLIFPNNTTDGGNNLNWDFGSLTISLDGATEAFPPLTPGTLVATSSIITIRSANQTGFSLAVRRSNATATLRLTTDTSLTIPDKTNWSPGLATTSAGNATASTTERLTLQFRVKQAGTDTPNYASVWWGTDDTTENALFAGLPATDKEIANRSISALATTTISVLYNLNVANTQASGAYSGDVIYTVTANP